MQLLPTYSDIKLVDKDPKGEQVDCPKNRTRAELSLMRARCDRSDIEKRMAQGISTSLEARKW